MKKKTFGRIAAVGLAGLTAVPAVAIVASADVTVNADNVMSGIAYCVEWTVRKDTTQYTANESTVAGKVQVDFTPAVPTQEFVAVSTAITDGDGFTYTLPDSQKIYYGFNSSATAVQTQTRNAATTANNNNSANYTEWQNKWKDYVWLSNLSDTEKAKLGDTIKQTPNAKQPVTANTTAAGIKPSESTFDRITYTANVTITNKSMKNLADEIGTAGKVAMSNGVIDSGSTYTLDVNNTNAGTTGSTGTNGTVYGQYDIPAGYRYASATSYYSYEMQTYYPNLPALRAAVGYQTTNYSAHTPSPAYSTANCYFDPASGNYYTLAQKNANYPLAVYVTSGSSTSTENAIYRVNGLYYYTWSSAYAAAGNNADNVTYIGTYTVTGNYFSRLTGNFYSTYSAALAASGSNGAYVVTLGGSYYGDYYDYLDPYYYYFMQKNNGSSSSSSSLGGSSVTIGNKSGWTNVRTSIRNASVGTTLNVSMGNETYIPEEILSALSGKNVDVNFTLKNGAVISFNGRDISNPKDVNVNVAYNTKNISSSLVNKAKSVNNAVTSSQINISSNTFGGTASLTVKFSTNRSGYTAKIYRYNSSRNSLQLVDTSRVASTGKVTFDKVTQGGDYVIVLC